MEKETTPTAGLQVDDKTTTQFEFIAGTGTPINLYISKVISDKLRAVVQRLPDALGVSKFSDDIIYTDTSVEPHTDNTKAGFNTILCVLINDPHYVFKHNDIDYQMPPGRVIRFDGNIKHSISAENNGRFAAIIWDIPIENSFVKEIGLINDRLIQLIYEFTTPQ